MDEDQEELVPVFVGSPRDAEVLRTVLEGSGMEVTTESSGVGGAYPVTVGDLGQTRLLVRSSDRDTAVALIDAGDDKMLDHAPETSARPAGARYALVAIAILLLVLIVLAITEGNSVT